VPVFEPAFFMVIFMLRTEILRSSRFGVVQRRKESAEAFSFQTNGEVSAVRRTRAVREVFLPRIFAMNCEVSYILAIASVP
jgi:hypothetical protein